MDLSSGLAEPASAAGCPFHQGGVDSRRTARDRGTGLRVIEKTADGVWQVRGFEIARQLLRGDSTRQAGFKADMLEKMPRRGKTPILFLEGKIHHEQRRLTAPFFTPRTVSGRYRMLMEALADKVLGEFRIKRRGDLSVIGMGMAVGVAAEVVGLTNSLNGNLDKRINAFFSGNFEPKSDRISQIREAINAQWRLGKFFFFDVLPAIRARRRKPQEDVISHLLSQGYSNAEILTECITYGAAGMITTREFITVCAWHMLDNPGLRERYLASEEAVRHAMLEEVLRLEPVVGTIFRRATEDIAIETDGKVTTIPAGEKIAIDVRGVNADMNVVGDAPLEIRPDRCPAARVGPSVMGFGDGHHRCPGSFLAIQESDIFLFRLLAIPGLRLERAPDVDWNDLVTGYELRRCMIACD